MAHEIIEAYQKGKLLIKLGDDLDSGIPFSKNSKIARSTLRDLILNPELFRIFIEPKKAWIDTNASEFYSSCYALKGVGLFKDGAIVLAREFLRQYKEANRNQDLRIRANVYTILKDLVGEENLK